MLTTSISSTKFRVAVVGGGVGGLCVAHELSKSPDIELDVYEAATSFSEIGAGIAVTWRAWLVLTAMGLGEDLEQILGSRHTGELRPAFEWRKSDQARGETFATLETQGKYISSAPHHAAVLQNSDGADVLFTLTGGFVSFHRAEFHGILLKHLGARCKTHTSKRLRDYSQPDGPGGPIQLFFRDGSIATCDVLVGADGIKSPSRDRMMSDEAKEAERRGHSAQAEAFRASIKPCWSGILAHRTLIPAEKITAQSLAARVLQEPTSFLGKDAGIVCYPIMRGKVLNFVYFTSNYDREGTTFPDAWVQEVKSEGLQESFRTWEPEAQQLVACVEDINFNRWAIHYVNPPPTYASGRVAILGDTAHAMLPFQGSGAGQAIEVDIVLVSSFISCAGLAKYLGFQDAYVLSALLSHKLTTLDNVVEALQVYSRIRRPVAMHAFDMSRRNGMYMLFNHARSDPSISTLEQLGAKLKDSWEWIIDANAAVDRQKAIDLLEKELGPKI